MKLSFNQRIVIWVALVLLLIPAMYFIEHLSKEKALHTGLIIKVNDSISGKVVALMGVDVLKALAKQEFPGGQNVKGPTLLYAIGSSGLSGYKRIEVNGLKSEKGIQIDKAAMGKNLILAINSRGTVSLIDSANGDHLIVDDVSEINKID